MGRKLNPEEYAMICKGILRKLHSKGAYVKGHLLFDRIQKGIPPHFRGHIKTVLKDLQKADLVKYYGPTKYGDAYQLNINKIKDILDIIKN